VLGMGWKERLGRGEDGYLGEELCCGVDNRLYLEGSIKCFRF